MTRVPFLVIHRHPSEHGGATGWERRWAYATLGEARRKACAEIKRRSNLAKDPVQPALDHAANLRESGGSISLPDGSEIVVEETTYQRLFHELRPHVSLPWTGANPLLLAAYNARFGTEPGDPCDHCEGSGKVWGEDEDGNPDDPDCESPCSRCGRLVPSPEQIQAAMPAMREWAEHKVGLHARLLGTLSVVRRLYPGGVEQFIKDQEGEADGSR